MTKLPRLTGPSGEIVEYDRAATELAYFDFGGDTCLCLGCKNYREAFEPKWIDRAVLEVCATIGIDSFKAIETTFYDMDPETGLAYYGAQYPFVGQVIAHVVNKTGYWGFSYSVPHQDTFGAEQAEISFSFCLPWVRPEPPPK